MSGRVTGRYVTVSTVGERVKAFVPSPLPPEPPLDLNDSDREILEGASRSLGKLDGLSGMLPDLPLFLYMYIRKEAVLSSQVEGTQSSLSDLLMYENDLVPGVPEADVVEASLYVQAMEHGLARMREGFPLSLRLLREMHGVLLSRGRGSHCTPGEFRRSQNWIGGTRPGNARFVPPPPEHLQDCLGALEAFLHDKPTRTSPLLKAALAHVQFETIHPFLDGNGRLGRLLIALVLMAEGALSNPVLYLSLYFKRNRPEYYERLGAVRTHGDWEGWVRFFLDGVKETADQAVIAARVLKALLETDTEKILSLGRRGPNALRVHRELRLKPFCTVSSTAVKLNLSFPAAAKSLSALEQLGIVREITGRERDRVYAYERYIELLAEGTEPLR
ncbi:MAG: Fic family protein [Deltaproteobacteria bacterium]|nr:Fic family protein [Deltaproteobacteria bacterium]